DFQARGLQGGDKRCVLVGFGGNEEDAGVAADVGEGAGAIVLGDVVAGRFDIDSVAVEAGVGQSLRKSEKIFAGGEFDFLFAERLVVAIEADGGGLRFVGLD